MNYFKKNLYKIILMAFVLIMPILSLAQEHVPPASDPPITPTPAPVPVTIVNPIGVYTVNGLIKTILEGVIKIGIPIIALAIIYSGFLFVSAQGKPESLKKAKDALIYTLIGAAILLGSWAIAQLITETVLAL